jgi:hypothetical protein
VPATVLTSAYSGEAVRLRLRLATGDVGIVTVADTGPLLPAGSAVAVRLDFTTAIALPGPAPLSNAPSAKR